MGHGCHIVCVAESGCFCAGKVRCLCKCESGNCKCAHNFNCGCQTTDNGNFYISGNWGGELHGDICSVYLAHGHSCEEVILMIDNFIKTLENEGFTIPKEYPDEIDGWGMYNGTSTRCDDPDIRLRAYIWHMLNMKEFVSHHDPDGVFYSDNLYEYHTYKDPFTGIEYPPEKAVKERNVLDYWDIDIRTEEDEQKCSLEEYPWKHPKAKEFLKKYGTSFQLGVHFDVKTEYPYVEVYVEKDHSFEKVRTKSECAAWIEKIEREIKADKCTEYHKKILPQLIKLIEALPEEVIDPGTDYSHCPWNQPEAKAFRETIGDIGIFMCWDIKKKRPYTSFRHSVKGNIEVKTVKDCLEVVADLAQKAAKTTDVSERMSAISKMMDFEKLMAFIE